MTVVRREVRCPGSDKTPARVWRGKAECRICGVRFEPKADGMVRRHGDRQPVNGRVVRQK
jgi:hypothetical protein